VLSQQEAPRAEEAAAGEAEAGKGGEEQADWGTPAKEGHTGLKDRKGGRGTNGRQHQGPLAGRTNAEESSVLMTVAHSI
jgi:hypothetical protein